MWTVRLSSCTNKDIIIIIKYAIIAHLNKHTLLRSSQHGFTSGKSCLTNLLLYLETVTRHVDDGMPVDTIYLDFAKAFDKVPHNRLIDKLMAHGVAGQVGKWIRCWLRDAN